MAIFLIVFSPLLIDGLGKLKYFSPGKGQLPGVAPTADTGIGEEIGGGGAVGGGIEDIEHGAFDDFGSQPFPRVIGGQRVEGRMTEHRDSPHKQYLPERADYRSRGRYPLPVRRSARCHPHRSE